MSATIPYAILPRMVLIPNEIKRNDDSSVVCPNDIALAGRNVIGAESENLNNSDESAKSAYVGWLNRFKSTDLWATVRIWWKNPGFT